MEQLPVDKCIDVLNVFCAHPNEDLWINKIVERVRNATGSRDSPKIKKAINHLKQAKILKVKKIGSQKQKQILTPLGIEIISLMVNIRDLKETLAKFYSKLNKWQKIFRKNKEMRNYTLTNEGWNKEDINSFHRIYWTFTKISELFEINICNLLIGRFLSLIKNTVSVDITIKIVTTLMIKEITNLSGFFAKSNIVDVSPISKETDNKLGQNTDPKRMESASDSRQKYFGSMQESFFEQLHETYSFNFFPQNESIISEGNDLIKSMIALAGLNTRQLEADKFFTSTGFLEPDEISRRILYPENRSKLVNIYAELIAKMEHRKNT